MGPRDDEPPDPGPEEGPVLAPEELDISEDEHVTEIDEGRFVVSPEGRPQDDPVASSVDDDEVESRKSAATAGDDDLQRADVHDWLAADLGGANSRYAFDVTATFGESVTQRRMVSNDVVTIFESLVLWYAQQLEDDTPVEEVLGILLLESSVPVRYPPRSLKRLVKSADLGPEDTIADLLAAVDADDGVQL